MEWNTIDTGLQKAADTCVFERSGAAAGVDQSGSHETACPVQSLQGGRLKGEAVSSFRAARGLED